MYCYDEDMIDWGDGWEDNEDGERIPVLAQDGTKPASLYKKYEEESSNTHTACNKSQSESSCDISTSTEEHDDDNSEKDEQIETPSPNIAVVEECENTSRKREPSWSDPIEADLAVQTPSGPPLRPRAENGTSLSAQLTCIINSLSNFQSSTITWKQRL